MLEIGPENALDYLRSIGQLGPGPARVQPLGWGVSNVVLRVETPERRFVLKQSRPQLRTRDAWFSDLDRVYREQEVMQVLRPLLPGQGALCHGDYSPKTILAHGGGFTLVDYETAHLGDPTMDLGFFLSHLMLKAIKRHRERERYFDLTRAFWRGYGREVTFRP